MPRNRIGDKTLVSQYRYFNRKGKLVIVPSHTRTYNRKRRVPHRNISPSRKLKIELREEIQDCIDMSEDYYDSRWSYLGLKGIRMEEINQPNYPSMEEGHHKMYDLFSSETEWPEELPPIIAVKEGNKYNVLDGWHRLAIARDYQFSGEVPAHVIEIND